MKKFSAKNYMLAAALGVLILMLTRHINPSEGMIGKNPPEQAGESSSSEILAQIGFNSHFSSYKFSPSRQKFVIAQSSDKGMVFYIRPTSEKDGGVGLNIKGDVKYNVDILCEDKKGKKTFVVEKNRPMVSLVKFSPNEKYIAFSGGKKLTIFDIKSGELLFENETAEDFVNYFGWGFEGNRIYTEFKRNTNGNIYDIDSSKLIMSYEAQEKVYPKGIIDGEYCYSTSSGKFIESDALDVKKNSKTLITSKDGTETVEIADGRFRGSHEKASIHVGENEFGLFYAADANSDVKRITGEYIYDAKFVCGGNIAYIVNEEGSENKFSLNITDPSKEGLEEGTVKIEVSGTSFAVTPDGRYGFIGGPLGEIVDFNEKVVSGKKRETAPTELEIEKKAVYETLIGGLDIFYKYEMTGIKDMKSIYTYYVDTENPSQWANFDIQSIMKEREKAEFIKGSDYVMSIRVDYVDFDASGEEPSASVGLRAFGQNSSGQSFGDDHSVELVKKDKKWYITGFSTFPQKSERERAMQAALKYINMACDGSIGGIDFKGFDVSLGQIQFWRCARAEFAADIEYADCCKVYLKVNGAKGKSVYRMIMEKALDGSWRFKEISNENLSGIM